MLVHIRVSSFEQVAGPVRNSLREMMRAARFISLHCGAVSSARDHAMECFWQLREGTVDYCIDGVEIVAGHRRYGDTYPGLLPLWSADRPIHILVYSFGASTARFLQHLLERGAFLDIEYGRIPTSGAWYAFVRFCAQTHTRTHTHTHTHTTYAHAHAYTHEHKHTRARAHTHTHAHARTHTHAHAHAHIKSVLTLLEVTHMHAHTRTHKHTQQTHNLVPFFPLFRWPCLSLCPYALQDQITGDNPRDKPGLARSAQCGAIAVEPQSPSLFNSVVDIYRHLLDCLAWSR